MWHTLLHVLEHAWNDTLPLLGWLVVMYVVIELLENKTDLSGNAKLGGKLGPLIGAATGLIPQCGFSVLASKLFEQKYITVGTLFAIFLSTSDEAFIILLSSGAEGAATVLPLIAVKIVFGVLVGYAVDGLLKWIGRGQGRVESKPAAVWATATPDTVHEIFMRRYFEENEVEAGCSCGRDHDGEPLWKVYILYPVLHALKVAAFVFLVNFALTGLIEWVGEENFVAFLNKSLFWQPFLASAVGLIPNCASSVAVTTAYLQGGIAFGSCAAGLCANAGLGFVVLLKNTRKWKRNLLMIVSLYLVSVAIGLLLNAVIPVLGV